VTSVEVVSPLLAIEWTIESGPSPVFWVAIVVVAIVSFFLLRRILRPPGGPLAPGLPGAPAPASALEQLAGGLAKTRDRLGLAIRRLLGQEADEKTLAGLEEAMLGADMGVAVTTSLVEDLKQAFRDKMARQPDELLAHLKGGLKSKLALKGNDIVRAPEKPTVVLVVGVNGTGKTTSIAKLATYLKGRGDRVLLCAGDTFRAAAVEQLTIWAERTGCDIIKAETGADPASVAFDAAEAAIARKVDYLIVDTAGRLHTHQNLMSELNKIKRVIQKKIPSAPHEVLLVLDATTGQNAIAQAREFKKAVDVTGLFLSKLDGTAKGGIVIAIREALDIPVKFVGLGEKPEDIQRFEPDRFVEALFSA
jgi:fused signal recognition particle receptor